MAGQILGDIAGLFAHLDPSSVVIGIGVGLIAGAVCDWLATR